MIKNNYFNEASQERMAKWEMSRGGFLKSLIAISLSAQLASCNFKSKENDVEEENLEITPLMSNQQANIIKRVQNILFPNDGNGPSVEEINAFPYLLWVMQDELIEKIERDYFIWGADWANQESMNLFNIPFLELSESIQVNIVDLMSKKKRSKLWLSKLITGIIEALLSDPVYGGNTGKVGWKWLGHNPGSPRSKDGYTYPEVIKSVRNEM